MAGDQRKEARAGREGGFSRALHREREEKSFERSGRARETCSRQLDKEREREKMQVEIEKLHARRVPRHMSPSPRSSFLQSLRHEKIF